MNLSTIISITEKSKKRVGLGHGSGRGKTAGRGTKGQKARGSVPLDFEGGGLPLIKRMPFIRGKNRNKSLKGKPVILDVAQLNQLPKDTIVDFDTLVKAKLVDAKEAKEYGIKILGHGELKTALKVQIPVSKSAAQKIEKAGGSTIAHE